MSKDKKRVMKLLLPTILCLLTTVSCRQSESLNESEKTKIINEVRQTLDSYYNDIKKSGLTAEFKYLDNSPEFFWVPPGFSCSISYDSVAAILKQNASIYTSIVNAFDTLRIIPLSRELATYTGRLRSSITDTSGKVMAFSLVETAVLIKREDGWKLLNGQTSNVNQ
ncbi:MAG TPA: nuclear transport factor 2 family protein [Bacteroidia bacterium]|nr:nuclear transport factor 2 family protein [Bacteroidia bacterium]